MALVVSFKTIALPRSRRLNPSVISHPSIFGPPPNEGGSHWLRKEVSHDVTP
ncbi:hypothetical protein HY967_03870 [Candidatus Jorgensenbacteria bacterium]|nr:hypothetical protein [Candidatus Jorgensenbacteria bacterium]